MKKIFLTIIILMIFISGCAYQDMNRLQFVTSTVLDENQMGEVVIYTELFSSDRGNGEALGFAKRTVTRGAGETIADAFYNMQTISSLSIAYDVNKAQIFTENIARKGLADYMTAFDINQKPTLKEFMFVCEGDPVELLNTKLEDEEYIGVYLDELMVFQEKQSRLISITINEYMNNRLIGSRVNIIPIIRKCNQPSGDRIEVSGGAVLVDDKMVEKLSSDEVATYKLLEDKIKIGDTTVQNPQDKDKLVSLLVLSNKTKRDIEYDGEKVSLNLNIKTIFSVQQVQGELNFTDERLKNELIENAKKEIKKRCTDLFEKYQEKNIDILNVDMQLKRKYPEVTVKDVLDITELNVNVTVELDGTENSTTSVQ